MSVFIPMLTLLMALVIYFDITRYVIPNWLNGLVILLYIPFAFMTGVDWQQALLAFIIMFAVGYIIFALRWMGGGDVKLLAALALWTGTEKLLEFVLVMTVLGGILAIFLLIIRKWLPLVYVRKENKLLPRIFQDKAPVPYGLAIAAGFLLYLWNGVLPGLAV